MIFFIEGYKIYSNFSKNKYFLMISKAFEAETTRLSNAPKNIKNEAIAEKTIIKKPRGGLLIPGHTLLSFSGLYKI